MIGIADTQKSSSVKRWTQQEVDISTRRVYNAEVDISTSISPEVSYAEPIGTLLSSDATCAVFYGAPELIATILQTLSKEGLPQR